MQSKYHALVHFWLKGVFITNLENTKMKSRLIREEDPRGCGQSDREIDKLLEHGRRKRGRGCLFIERVRLVSGSDDEARSDSTSGDCRT